MQHFCRNPRQTNMLDAALPRPTHLAQTLLRAAIRPGDTVIDATAGHGHDTVFLAQCVGAGGRVLAFDIQKQAIQSAQAAVTAVGFGARVTFYHASHTRMADHAAAHSVAAIMFNLGYLPGDNHQLTTTAPETLTAMAQATRLLQPGGLLTAVCYPGHPAGALEAIHVEEWLTTLTGHGWQLAKYEMLGTLRPPPFLLVAGQIA